MKVLVLNGPNLNLLGLREPSVYGTTTLRELDQLVARWGEAIGIEVETLQSNHEGDLIDAIQRDDLDGIVINPAAYTHTSRAIPDAIAAVPTPTVEVHISNVKEREPWRAVSLVSDSCVHTIYGRGLAGYRDALLHLANRGAAPTEKIAYGEGPDQFGDLRRGHRGLVILIHGGFWRRQYLRDTMESLAVDLFRRGITSWNLEYRRLGEGGGWPESFDDVAQALDHVPALGTDPGPVVVVGHSAGAHLAISAAQETRTDIGLLIALAPVVDLGRQAESGLEGSAEAARLLAAGAPSVVTPGSVETILVHGSGDELVPSSHSADLAAGSGMELIETDTGHFQLLDPRREPWPALAGRIEALFG